MDVYNSFMSFPQTEVEHNIPRLHQWHYRQIHQCLITNLSSPAQTLPLACREVCCTAVIHLSSAGHRVMLRCIYNSAAG